MFIASRGNQKVFLDLAHLREKLWTGGKYRSLQTYEIFEKAGFTMEPVDDPKRPGKFGLLMWALRGVMKFGLYRPFCLDSLRTTGYGYFRSSALVAKYPDVKVYLMEGTGFGAMQYVRILKSLGRKVVLAPINVESLVPYNAWTHTIPALKRFEVELPFYQEADAVFCISLEEYWLLSILQANTFYLPYIPPRELMQKINERREERKKRTKSGILYVANWYNSPNYLGLKGLIEEGKYLNRSIRIAGFGISKIQPLIEGKKEFVVLGELSDEQLEEEMRSCEKVFFNHFPTSGMLTRIPELILAGIPIEGNLAALKAYSMISNENPTDQDRNHLLNVAAQSSEKLLAKVVELQ